MSDRRETDRRPHAGRQWHQLVVGEPSRLDTFLSARLPHLSRRKWNDLAARGRVRVNGRTAAKGTALRVGDTVQVDAGLVAVKTLRPQMEPALPVVYADDFLAAVDKPCDVASIAQSALDVGTAANFLIAAFPETAALDPRGLEAGFVHRLDTATSGVLLAARTAAARSALRGQFRRREIVKRYRALVVGAVRGAGRCSLPIRNRPRDRSRVEVVEVLEGGAAGQAAETSFRPLRAADDTTLLEVEIHTGARHQIRAHLAFLGHPIIGDQLYGGPPAHRLMLHASELELLHPVGGRPLVLAAPIPAELAAD